MTFLVPLVKLSRDLDHRKCFRLLSYLFHERAAGGARWAGTSIRGKGTEFVCVSRLREEIWETQPPAPTCRVGKTDWSSGKSTQAQPFPLQGWPGSVMIRCSNPPVATQTRGDVFLSRGCQQLSARCFPLTDIGSEVLQELGPLCSRQGRSGC
jgi:hypothetical protein